jgi:hypothetical protein
MTVLLDRDFNERLQFRTMSYRVAIGNAVVEMDSAKEVYELLEKSAGEGSMPASIEERIIQSDWNEANTQKLSRSLPSESLQRRAIRVLYHGSADGLSREDLLKEMAIEDAQKLGGVLSGLSKNAKKLKLVSPINIEKTRDQSGRRTYLYKLHSSFRATLELLDRKKTAASERELPEFRDYIRTKRAALAGFLEQGASLSLHVDTLFVVARNDIYRRYLHDNRLAIQEFASEYFERPITAIILEAIPIHPNGQLVQKESK